MEDKDYVLGKLNWIRTYVDELEDYLFPTHGIAMPYEDRIDPLHCSDYNEYDCNKDPCPDCMLSEGNNNAE